MEKRIVTELSRLHHANMSASKMRSLARHLRKRSTWAEKTLWRWLRDRRFSDFKFRRQQIVGPYILDFFCFEARLAIELDGFGHGEPHKLREDAARDAWLKENGIRVLRYWNWQIRSEPEWVRDRIWQTLQEQAPHPLPHYCQPLIHSRQDASPSP